MSAVIRLGRKDLLCAVPFFCLIAGPRAQSAHCRLPDGNAKHGALARVFR